MDENDDLEQDLYEDDENRCESCEGTGEIVVGWEYPEYVDCPHCKGTGKARDFPTKPMKRMREREIGEPY